MRAHQLPSPGFVIEARSLPDTTKMPPFCWCRPGLAPDDDDELAEACDTNNDWRSERKDTVCSAPYQPPEQASQEAKSSPNSSLFGFSFDRLFNRSGKGETTC